MAETERGSPVVCDAGPLIHLHELDCLHVLDFPLVIVPDVVLEEALDHRPGAEKDFQRFEIRPSPSPSRRILSIGHEFSLHRGEMAALACIENQPDVILLTDDAAARLATRALGYRGQGTIGVILRAIRRGLLDRSQVEDLLRSLPERSTLHIRPGLLNTIIEEVRRGDS